MKRAVALVVSAALISGCATVDMNYRPVIDTSGTDHAKMEKDLNECRQFAKERMDAANGAVAGAVAGAVLGVAFGAILGASGRDLSRIAGASALGGGLGTANAADKDQKSIIANCMLGRGYKVLAR